MNVKTLLYIMFLAVIPNFVQASSKPDNEQKMVVTFHSDDAKKHGKSVAILAVTRYLKPYKCNKCWPHPCNVGRPHDCQECWPDYCSH